MIYLMFKNFIHLAVYNVLSSFVTIQLTVILQFFGSNCYSIGNKEKEHNIIVSFSIYILYHLDIVEEKKNKKAIEINNEKKKCERFKNFIFLNKKQ